MSNPFSDVPIRTNSTAVVASWWNALRTAGISTYSAFSTLTSARIFIGNSSNEATERAISGDISLSNTGVTAYVGTVPIAKGGTGQTTAIDGFNALSPMTTTGDTTYRSAGNTAVRLAIGTAGYLYQANTIPQWVAVSGAITIDTSGVTTYSGTVPLNKGGTGQTTKTAAFDALSPMTTAGDIIFGDTGGTNVRLAVGAQNTVLQVGASSVLQWRALGTIVESTFALAAWPITANQYGDLASISLTAGTWHVSFHVYSDNNGAVTTSQIAIGVGTVTGNDATGLSTVTNRWDVNPIDASSGQSRVASLACYTLAPGSTTTYYLKGFAGTSITNLRAAGRITAILIK